MADVIHENAPAKINLALHVTGQRADGYHLLDTLVTFAASGDRLRFEVAAADEFTLSGRFGAALPTDAGPGTGNLVLRARDALRRHAAGSGQATGPVRIHLEKNLPVASGIGGGSADAAATLRGLIRLWGLTIDAAELQVIALALGADVPMCLESQPLIARGIGEDITLLPDFPDLALLLVNPLVEVSTPAIFRALASKSNPPLVLPTGAPTRQAWLDALTHARNDLQPPAEAIAPEIAEAMALLTSTRPLLARMSGSGATCFGVYATMAAAREARATLEAAKPQWYLQETETFRGRHVQD